MPEKTQAEYEQRAAEQEQRRATRIASFTTLLERSAAVANDVDRFTDRGCETLRVFGVSERLIMEARPSPEALQEPPLDVQSATESADRAVVKLDEAVRYQRSTTAGWQLAGGAVIFVAIVLSIVLLVMRLI